MVLTRDETEVKEKFFPKLARVLAQVPFAEDLLAAYYLRLRPGNAGQGQGHPASGRSPISSCPSTSCRTSCWAWASLMTSPFCWLPSRWCAPM